MAMNDVVGNVLAAYGAGRTMGLQRRRDNALAQMGRSLYPEESGPPPLAPRNDLAAGSAGGTYKATGLNGPPGSRGNAMRELVGLGDFETVNSLLAMEDRGQADRTRDAVAPMIREGRYGAAGQEAAAMGQTDLARQLFQLGRDDLDATQQRGQRGASAIFAALNLPLEQRAGFMAQHRGLALEAGIPAEAFDQADWSDDASLRAIAEKWLEASKLAGEVSLQKFGDSVQTWRTGPSGSEVLDSREVPVTRAETLDRQRIEYAQDTDRRDFAYRQQRDRADDQWRQDRATAEDEDRRFRRERESYSRGDIEGAVLNKAISSGLGSLSPEERSIYDRYIASGSSGGWGMPMANAPAAQSAPPPSGDGQGAGSRSNPARVSSEADFDRLPPGAWFVNPADGQLLQKER